MGTRGLTAVYFDGAYRIAQYGQWDHYPGGQGRTVLAFCRKLRDPAYLSQFATALAACRFVTKDEIRAAYARVGVDPACSYLTMEQARAFERELPFINRDHGAEVLELVARGTYPLLLQDSITFAADSLFCEWAYVVDLEANTLEVFKGFNTEHPLAESDRFAWLNPIASGENFAYRATPYHPVRLAAKWSLDALPTEQAFLCELCPPDDE